MPRRLLHFLDEHPHHNDAAAGGGEINCSRNAVAPPSCELPELAFEMFDSIPKQTLKTDLPNDVAETQKARLHVSRQALDLCIDDPVERLEVPAHSAAYI